MNATLEFVRIARDMQACGDTAAAEQVLAEVAPDFEYVRRSALRDPYEVERRARVRARRRVAAPMVMMSQRLYDDMTRAFAARSPARSLYLNPDTYEHAQRSYGPRVLYGGWPPYVLAEVFP